MINYEENPDFVNSFLNYYTSILNKSPETVYQYNHDINMFLKYMKNKFHLSDEENFSIDTLKKIKEDDIYEFLSYLTNTHHYKSATRARKVASIRMFFKYLKKKKLISSNPAEDIEAPKIDKRLPKYLDLDESKKLLQVAVNSDNRNSERDYAIITLFLNCGMRLSELVGISIKDINFSDMKLTVIGKGNKERTIYLNKACINAINNYLAVRPQGKDDTKNSKDALFLSERRERISKRTVQYVVDKELLAAGLDTKKYSTHKLRHTAATLMYQYGEVDIRALQKLLGHQSISTTQIYTHVSDDQVRNAVESNPLADI